MLNLVLYRPELPANTGNIIRLCANFGAALHLIGPLGFFLDDRHLRRAGLDYHELCPMTTYVNFADFMERAQPPRLIASTCHATRLCHEFAFRDGDFIIFGRETAGLSDEVYARIPGECRLKIPMAAQSRCINLSNSVAIVAYEALRQLDFAPLSDPASPAAAH